MNKCRVQKALIYNIFANRIIIIIYSLNQRITFFTLLLGMRWKAANFSDFVFLKRNELQRFGYHSTVTSLQFTTEGAAFNSLWENRLWNWKIHISNMPEIWLFLVQVLNQVSGRPQTENQEVQHISNVSMGLKSSLICLCLPGLKGSRDIDFW